MNNTVLQDFIDKYNEDKEEFNRKFENISYKLQNIDKKFDDFNKGMQKVNERLEEIEDVQSLIFGNLGGVVDKLDNVRMYLSSIETKINKYKTLNVQGEKVINGEIYMLKIKLQKVKPIVNWENDKLLSSKYREIEEKVLELEGDIGKTAV